MLLIFPMSKRSLSNKSNYLTFLKYEIKEWKIECKKTNGNWYFLRLANIYLNSLTGSCFILIKLEYVYAYVNI